MKKVILAINFILSSGVFGMSHMSCRDIMWFASARDGDLTRISEIAGDIDLNKRDEGGNTALMVAARRGNFDVVSALIRSDINAINKKGETALILATRAGHHGIVKLLIDAGADVNAESWGSGYFEIAIKRFQRSERLAQRARKLGFGQARHIKGRSALAIATELGDTAVVKWLVDAGADVDISDDGRFPLINSLKLGFTDIARHLISAGADVNVVDRAGSTPLSVANEEGYRDIVYLLKKAGAN